MKLKKLNNTQEEQLKEVLPFYKRFYICNDCGSVYGSDYTGQKFLLCPDCELKQEQENEK
jgi:rubrerythrin